MSSVSERGAGGWHLFLWPEIGEREGTKKLGKRYYRYEVDEKRPQAAGGKPSQHSGRTAQADDGHPTLDDVMEIYFAVVDNDRARRRLGCPARRRLLLGRARIMAAVLAAALPARVMRRRRRWQRRCVLVGRRGLA